jgi:uncharacterized protein (UPF0332 family)
MQTVFSQLKDYISRKTAKCIEEGNIGSIFITGDSLELCIQQMNSLTRVTYACVFHSCRSLLLMFVLTYRQHMILLSVICVYLVNNNRPYIYAVKVSQLLIKHFDDKSCSCSRFEVPFFSLASIHGL